MIKKKTKNQTTKHNNIPTNERGREVPTTLIGHVNELKNRLFWVVIFFLVSAAAVYPFFTQIVEVLTAPLAGEELHYFSPAGGLGFIIKICMYLGFVGALPAFIYHFYKFIQPAMSVKRSSALIGYTLASVFLAICGVLFTYNLILPAAVKFLTSFEIAGVDPMLSVDSYMAFVIAYIVAGAFLFQLPLVMLIINSITPLKPSALLSYERHIVIGAFIIGAVLSPTPDVVNQALLALPLIVMYQLGFALVVVKNRLQGRVPRQSGIDKLRSTTKTQEDESIPLPTKSPMPAPKPMAVIVPTKTMRTMDVRRPLAISAKPVSHEATTNFVSPPKAQRRVQPQRGTLIDGAVRTARNHSTPTLRRPQTKAFSQAAGSYERHQRVLTQHQRGMTIDGVVRSPQLVRS